MDESEKLSQVYGKLARYYDTDKPPVWQEIEDLLSDIVPGSAVLDVGCGTGRILQVLPANVKYTGLDNSPELLAIAGRRHPTGKFISADARALPFPDKSFDAVLVIAVAHHFLKEPERLAVLAEAKRVLKKGGRVYVSVWNLNQSKFWKNWRGWRKAAIPSKHDPGIKRIYYVYSQPQLRSELEAVGFKIERFGLAGQNIVAKARG